MTHTLLYTIKYVRTLSTICLFNYKPCFSFYGKHAILPYQRINCRYFSSALPLSHNNYSINKIFDSPIPSEFIFAKNKPVSIFFKIWEFHSSSFYKSITNNIPCGFVYTIFTRVRYNMNEYLMAGNQFGFQFYGLPEIEVLYDNVTQRLVEYMKEYNII